jgi:hypothetical protein
MNTGQIVKSKTTNRFTTIPNEILFRKDLSLKAKGLICTLLSLPTDWAINKKQLPEFSTDGYDAMASAFKELEEKGYIVSIRVLDKGKFQGWNYVVYDDPSVPIRENPDSDTQPIRENPAPVFPGSENPHLLNTNNTKDLNTKLFVEPDGSTPPPPPGKPKSTKEEKGEALTNPAPQENKKEEPPVARDPLTSKAYSMIVKKQLIDDPKTTADKAHNWNTISGFLKENPGFPYPEPYMDLWNIYAAKRALPQVLTVNATRQRKIATRVQEKPFNFIRILEVMSKSTFLLEQWPASFDWLIDNDNNYVKVLEGNYK